MLLAFDENNKIISSEDALKEKDGIKLTYYCPSCGGELILRKGLINMPHFAHTNDETSCMYKQGGESATHDAMKIMVKKIVEKWNNPSVSEYEYRISNNIADVYFEINGKKIAVECVHKHTDISEFRRKNEEYYHRGVYVLWVFNLEYFLNKDNSFKDQLRIAHIYKEAHSLYYGNLWCVDLLNHRMYSIHLKKLKGSNGYFMKQTRGIDFYLLKSFKLCNFKERDTVDDMLYLKESYANIVSPFIPSNWFLRRDCYGANYV